MKSSIASTPRWKRWSDPLRNEAVRSHQAGGTRFRPNQKLPRRQGRPADYPQGFKEIRSTLKVLGANPGIGHAREDITDLPVKSWPVYSYLIVYDPETNPFRSFASCTECATSRRF